MKKYYKFQKLALLFVISFFSVNEVSAQLLPPTGPSDPSVDVLDGLNSGLNAVQKAGESVEAAREQVQTEINGRLQKLKNLIPFKLDASILHKKPNTPNIPVARKIENSTVADIQDEDSLAEAFEKLFMRYPLDILDEFPEDQTAVRNAYDDMGKMYVNDSLIEMYLAVRSLDERMSMLKAEFDKLSSCYVQGNGSAGQEGSLCQGASATDANQGIWNNYYRINLIYDSMLRITEELNAIYANYEVTQAMRRGLRPLDREIQMQEQAEEEEQHSADASDILRYRQVISSSYAQMFTRKAGQTANVKETALSSEKNAALKDANPKKAKSAVKTSAKHNIVEAKPSAIYSRFTGAADQFKDLAYMNNLYEQLNLAKRLHNLKQQMPTFKESFVEIAKMRQLHDKAVEKLKESEDCVVQYLGKYYENPQNVWLGSGCYYNQNKIICNANRAATLENLKLLQDGDVLCQDNQSQICNQFGLSNYAKRGGFSGWLISAYKTAKAEKALDIEAEDVSPEIMPESAPDLADIKTAGKNFVKQQRSGLTDDVFAKPSKTLEVNQTNREIELLSWQIGAEGAKALGKDMASANPKWGNVKKPYPLWNDEKYVYQQYLKEKYRNMKLFVKQMDLRKATIKAAQKISDSLIGDNLSGLSIASIKSFNKSFLDPLAERIMPEENADQTGAAAVKKANDLKLNQLLAAYDRKTMSLDSSRSEIYKNMDLYGVELKENKEAYNRQSSEAAASEAQIEGQHIALSVSQKRKALNSKAVSGFETRAEAEIKRQGEIGEQVSKQKDNTMIQIDNAREKIDDLRMDVENVDQEKKKITGDYVLEASLLEDQSFKTLKQADLAAEAAEPKFKLGTSSSYTEALGRISDTKAEKAVLNMIVGAADGYALDVQEELARLVDEAYEKIESMGDAVYDPENYAQLLQIHQNLMTSLKSAQNIALATTLPVGDIGGAISALYAAAVNDIICDADACMQEDGRYFVGLEPKAEDFSAPKRIARTYTAPVREVVHFDTVDYASVAKTEDTNKTTRTAFLDYGQDIPQIWETILSSGGFVEKDVDISAILEHQDEADALLLRGGNYPCSIGQHTMDVRDDQLYVYAAAEKLPTCKGIKSVSLFANGKADIILDNGDRISGETGEKPEDKKPSELAMLLKYDNGLSMNDKISEIMSHFKKMEEDGTAEQYSAKEELYEKALLNRNQFGDFLDFVEQEMIYQKAMDKLNTNLVQTRARINTELQKFGYDLGEDFDLADEKNYNDIMQKLDEHKNKVVNHSVQELGLIKSDNKAVKERKDKLRNLLKALQEDKDELVQINDNTQADSSFTEQIKRMQTDKSVMKKYKEEGQEEFEKQLNSFRNPYCAVY